ncbi:ABC transporter substrate-binding protein [Peribacillus muralis]|uniref:ABC transporter substrate-binding protein n=1 Tax=Peribacillus muralis TaxID=264697 RepID=UPI001F4D8B56|nr:ABC transporter substrate-binding protein [Peribacillus muralis]MCK1993630.1 ABC transporter substrate-binding protein [Peribacillus muralis]MCK2014082.1 ABC transporter substrate-binding protein [Peribacillus muralis]
MKNLKVLLGFMLLIIVVLAGCNKGDSPASNSGSKGKSENVVNIGFSGPLSGAAALYGKRTLNGVEMAVNEINDAGGFEVDGKKYTLNLVSLDDKYLPNETGANAKRLIQEYDTPIIFTPHSGGVLALQVFNEQEEFIIGAYTSEPAVTEGGNSLTVRIPPNYEGYIEPFTTYAMKNSGKKIAALPTASQYGKDWTEAVLPFWEKQGGKVVYNSSIDFAKETDFFTIVTNALKKDPDVLFIGGASEPTAKVAKQARELGFKGGFIIMDQAKLDQMKPIAGSYETLEGSIGVLPLMDSEEKAVPAFVEKYQKNYKEDPSSEVGLNYIAMYAFVEAMKSAGSVDDAKAIREHMQDGLTNIGPSQKIYDIPSIDKNGGFASTIVVGAVENGKVVPLR